MALEQSVNGTAQQDPGTAQNTQIQPPAQSGAVPASTAQTSAQDVEKELQRLRSQSGREIAAAKRAAEQAVQAAEQMRIQNRTLLVRDMTEAERLVFERDEAVQYAQATGAELQAERQRIANEQQRAADMKQVSDETGIPFSELADVESFDEAWKRGIAYMKQQSPAANAQEEERRLANQPFVGGGAPQTPVSRREKVFTEAYSARDAHAYALALLNGE